MMLRKSRMLVLLNRLKAEARADWLTDSQATALAEIQRQWRFPERLNLYGPPGSGKTLLAWTVARASGTCFYPSPRAYMRQARQLQERSAIIDNAPDDVLALRHFLAALQLDNMRTALLITTQPNRLGLPLVPLPAPTRGDVDLVFRNLSLVDHYAVTPVYASNLWDVVAEVL